MFIHVDRLHVYHKRAVLNGSTRSCFKLFLNFTYEEEFTVSLISFDFTKLSIEVIEYARFQNNYTES